MLSYYLISNNIDHVFGVTKVDKRFSGRLHSHAEDGIVDIGGLQHKMRPGDEAYIEYTYLDKFLCKELCVTDK